MFTQLLDRLTGTDVIPDWPKRVQRDVQKHLEREGLSGFHFPAPKRWEPRPTERREGVTRD